MNKSHIDDVPKEQLRKACHQFLKKAIDVFKECVGSSKVPKNTFSVLTMEPSEPGRYSSKESAYTELDIDEMWHTMHYAIVASEAWKDARESVQSYIDAYKIEPTGFWGHSIEGQYLVPLLKTYLEDVKTLTYYHNRAQKVINMMLQHLDSAEVEVHGYIILEGFEAEHSFRLGKELFIHPIQEPELIMLGRSDTRLALLHYELWRLPHTDWWICETRIANPRGTAIGWNRIHDIVDSLALVLRMFKPGSVAIGFATQQLTGPFGRWPGRSFGGKLQQITVGGEHYFLSSSEIGKFTKFWQRLNQMMEQPQHYLWVPLRRMRAAGTRGQKEDALVDYVIGLEALLGTENERTELGYRFKVRGSVLLSKHKKERKKYLEDLGELYRLRSAIVHGSPVSTGKLERYLPLAETALRNVWNWYFRYWCDKSDNRAGIKQIDEELVS